MARVLSHVERDLWDTIQKRAARLTPAMQRSIEKSFDLLRDSLSMGEIERLVKSGGAEAFIGSIFDDASLNRTFSPARAELINSVGKSANGFIQDLPGGGAAAAGVFDILDPRVSEAIRTLDTTVMPPPMHLAAPPLLQTSVRPFSANAERMNDATSPTPDAVNLALTSGTMIDRAKRLQEPKRENQRLNKVVSALAVDKRAVHI